MFYTTPTIDELFNSLAVLNPNKYNHRSRKYETEITDDGVTLTIETPGYNKNLIDVSVEDDMLIVEGKSNSGNLDGFKEKFTLNDKFDADNIKANVVDGVLSVSVPYLDEVKPRKIAIKVK